MENLSKDIRAALHTFHDHVERPVLIWAGIFGIIAAVISIITFLSSSIRKEEPPEVAALPAAVKVNITPAPAQIVPETALETPQPAPKNYEIEQKQSSIQSQNARQISAFRNKRFRVGLKINRLENYSEQKPINKTEQIPLFPSDGSSY